jgi:DNA gyrase subunit A
MLISDNGTLIRCRARDISKISRDTQGVRIMKIDDNDSIIAVKRLPKDYVGAATSDVVEEPEPEHESEHKA